jgi:hypothetical protein
MIDRKNAAKSPDYYNKKRGTDPLEQ